MTKIRPVLIWDGVTYLPDEDGEHRTRVVLNEDQTILCEKIDSDAMQIEYWKITEDNAEHMRILERAVVEMHQRLNASARLRNV